MVKLNKISYGTIIKNLRSERNISQTELGDLVGVSKSAISSYELETATPNIQVFLKICIVCNAKISIKLDNKNYTLEELSREFL